MYQIKLSPYAKIFYTEWLLDPDSPRYNIVIDQLLYGNLDVNRLKTALKRYVKEHVILNSHIQDINDEPYWVKNSYISELEYSDSPIIQTKLLEYVTQSFALCSGPLYRFQLSRISDGVYRFILVFHHLVVDGSASLDIGVFESISNYYNDENYAAKCSIDEQICLMANLADSLFSRLEQNRLKYKKFWEQQLSDIESIDLSFLKLCANYRKETAAKPYNTFEEIAFSYGDVELAKLAHIKLKYNITQNIYDQCILALLLHKYTGKNHLAISYPIAIKEGINFLYGAQINTNLIPFQLNDTTTIDELFNQSRDFFHLTARSDNKYGYYSITDIIQDTNSKQLLNVCFAQTFFRENPFEFHAITKVEILTKLRIDGVTNNMLLFEHDARKNKLNYRIRYDSKVIDQGLLSNFVASYKKLFLEVLEDLSSSNDSKQIINYSPLTNTQYNQLAYDFNKTEKNYHQEKTIHALFEEQVQKTPNNIAVVYEDTKITYKELNKKANQLTHYLQQHHKIKADDLIVLCLDRSVYMVVAIIATLKSGGAYVPLEPSYPNDRISYILDDTNAKAVITNDAQKNRLKEIIGHKKKAAPIIAIDEERMLAILAKGKNVNPVIRITSSNLIYVIYTSGTTGNPKGVLVEHRSVINYITYLIDEAKLNSKSRGSKYASLGFDASVTEIYPILLSGGALHIITEEHRLDPLKINAFFHKHNITYAFLPTKMAELFFKVGNNSLVTMVVGGEKLENFIDQPYKVINAYGPTETTVQPTSFVVDRVYANIPIGKPINNVKCYIVDNNMNLLPMGVTGELIIGGTCLARGYLNRLDLTTEKFVLNPFQTIEEKMQNINHRVYKTGDLVRMLPDGNMEYIGRNDSQVKIRGYRIELGEIENKLAKYDGVKQVVVLAKERASKQASDKYLVAYYVANHKLDEGKMHDYLVKQLPEYMVPSILIYIKQLPLTINGKLDHKRLPEPIFTNKSTYIAPRNEQEKLVCNAFAKILSLEKIGIYDDFFTAGGNSILAIKLISILQNHGDVKVADIFLLRTPAKIAKSFTFGKNILIEKLEQIKLTYQSKPNGYPTTDNEIQKQVDKYLANIQKFKIDNTKVKLINNILLTGATGYLGCNLLNQLLKSTGYNIYVLIRAPSQESAFERINKKFCFYFDKTLDGFANNRLFIVKADLEKIKLDLTDEEYTNLASKIDSIIHAAALVKHYGDYATFYSANVKSTVNLLEFTKLTKLKDFHYISTYSVLNFGFIPENKEYFFTEDSLPDVLEPWKNVYVQTKLQGEKYAIRYRMFGINSNIYRVGNLAFIAENGRAQENIEDNAFYHWLKCLFQMNCTSKDINMVEVSPVDLTANAIVKLFDKQSLNNNTYHVFNPHVFDLSQVFSNRKDFSINTLPMQQFIDNIVHNLNNDTYHNAILRFLLHKGWLDGMHMKDTTAIKILQNRTEYVLKQAGFHWLPVTNDIFQKYLNLLEFFEAN